MRTLPEREGRLGDDEAGSEKEATALDACQAASMRNVVAFAPRADKPLRKTVLPVIEPSAPRTHESRGVGGSNPDIGPVIKPH